MRWEDDVRVVSYGSNAPHNLTHTIGLFNQAIGISIAFTYCDINWMHVKETFFLNKPFQWFRVSGDYVFYLFHLVIALMWLFNGIGHLFGECFHCISCNKTMNGNGRVGVSIWRFIIKISVTSTSESIKYFIGCQLSVQPSLS